MGPRRAVRHEPAHVSCSKGLGGASTADPSGVCRPPAARSGGRGVLLERERAAGEALENAVLLVGVVAHVDHRRLRVAVAEHALQGRQVARALGRGTRSAALSLAQGLSQRLERQLVDVNAHRLVSGPREQVLERAGVLEQRAPAGVDHGQLGVRVGADPELAPRAACALEVDDDRLVAHVVGVEQRRAR